MNRALCCCPEPVTLADFPALRAATVSCFLDVPVPDGVSMPALESLELQAKQRVRFRCSHNPSTCRLRILTWTDSRYLRSNSTAVDGTHRKSILMYGVTFTQAIIMERIASVNSTSSCSLAIVL
jgi:hypothetical protein